MALKATIATKADLDQLPEPQRALYTEKDGKFVLDVEGMAPATELHDVKTKLAEFRDNNVALTKKVTELEPLVTKFKDVDPDEYKTLKAEADKLKKKGLTKADDLEAAITAAVQQATKPLADKLAAEEQARITAQRAADQARFRELVTADATKAGVTPKSVRHVIREAEEKFELKDGTLAPRAGMKHPSDPLKELTPADWLQDLAKTDDYLFEPSTGGGANGNSGGGGGRPGAKQLINPTPEDMGRHMDAIAKGEMVVVRQ